MAFRVGIQFSTRPLIPISPYQEGSWKLGSQRIRVSALRLARVVAVPRKRVIAVDRQDIDQRRAGRLLVSIEFLKEPRVVVSIIVRPIIRVGRTAPVRLIQSAEVHRPPAPLFKADDLGAWIGRADGGRVSHDLVVHLVVRGWVWMDVAMRGIPQRRLVIENVILDASRA